MSLVSELALETILLSDKWISASQWGLAVVVEKIQINIEYTIYLGEIS